MLIFEAFQRGFISRNRTRDDEARLKSLEEKPSVPAGGASVPAGGVNCSLYAAWAFVVVLCPGKPPSTGPKWKFVLSLEFLRTQQWGLGLDFKSSGPNPIFHDFSSGPYLQLRIAVNITVCNSFPGGSFESRVPVVGKKMFRVGWFSSIWLTIENQMKETFLSAIRQGYLYLKHYHEFFESLGLTCTQTPLLYCTNMEYGVFVKVTAPNWQTSAQSLGLVFHWPPKENVGLFTMIMPVILFLLKPAALQRGKRMKQYQQQKKRWGINLLYNIQTKIVNRLFCWETFRHLWDFICLRKFFETDEAPELARGRSVSEQNNRFPIFVWMFKKKKKEQLPMIFNFCISHCFWTSCFDRNIVFFWNFILRYFWFTLKETVDIFRLAFCVDYFEIHLLQAPLSQNKHRPTLWRAKETRRKQSNSFLSFFFFYPTNLNWQLDQTKKKTQRSPARDWTWSFRLPVGSTDDWATKPRKELRANFGERQNIDKKERPWWKTKICPQFLPWLRSSVVSASDRQSEDPGAIPGGAPLCFFFSSDPAVSSHLSDRKRKEFD